MAETAALEKPVHELQFTDRTGDMPAAALEFTAAEFALGDNGDAAKSAPVKILARSPGESFHWYWGRCVHDLAGMKLHNSRLPIDYCHDYAAVIGYLNKFKVTVKGLETSGALVPFKDSDRATEIIHKQKNGVPYEASVASSFDEMVIEEVSAGAEVEANGQTFTGPLVIFRKWHLRGVAICPYGADMNTSSEFKRSQGAGESVPVHIITKTASPKKGALNEAKIAGDMTAAQSELKRFINAFGIAKGGEWFAAGKTFKQARQLHIAEMEAENKKLRRRLEAAGVLIEEEQEK